MKGRIIAATTFALALTTAGTAFGQTGDAQVTVVHGVPGLTVDVYVDGALVLDDFTYQTITDPVTLPAGDHTVEVYPGDADPEASEPAISATVTLPAGANASAVAHLDAEGAPTLTPFVNDVSTIAAGEARVAVRHTAAAPAVDVTANDAVAIAEGATNGAEAVATVPADTYSVDVTVSGSGDAVFSDVPLALNEGTLTIVYAVGSADAGYELLTDTISGLHSTPTAVPAGDAGLVGDDVPVWVLGLMGLGALALATPVASAARRR